MKAGVNGYRAIQRYALAGRAYSGKTTLARRLEQEGFVFWSYTDYLKELAAHALRSIGMSVSVEDILAQKSDWRPFLVSMSERIHFDSGYWVRRFIQTRLREHGGRMPDQVVWDNCRFPEQYEALKDYGFTLVMLELSDNEQFARAQKLGVTPGQVLSMRHEVTEQEFPDVENIFRLEATLWTETMLDILLG